ncbi:phage regulatory CII family protein [Paraburkholderia fungorum]|nr:phage regulatory CII family protein [Paraburkholderia fungorum]
MLAIFACSRAISFLFIRFTVLLWTNESYENEACVNSMKNSYPQGVSVTCRYSDTTWIDVLYTSVLKTPGKVEDAARFLTERRGIRLTGESLRLKLREVEGARISGEMFELIVEWMLEKNQPHALDAVHAFNVRFGLVASLAPRPDARDGITALVTAALGVSDKTGKLAEEVRRSAEDGVIEPREVEAIERIGRDGQRQIEQTITIARAAAALNRV